MLGHMAAEVIQTHLKCIVASCYEKRSWDISLSGSTKNEGITI